MDIKTIKSAKHQCESEITAIINMFMKQSECKVCRESGIRRKSSQAWTSGSTMFEINRQPLITEVRCRECRASIEVNSDSRRAVEKSVTEFQKRHHCRPIENKDN